MSGEWPEPQAEGPPPWEIHSIEAEAALLGGLMVSNAAIPMVAEILVSDDFYDPLHGRIYKAILTLHERGKSPNPVLLRPIFQNDPDMKEVGGPAYLAQLTGSAAAVIGVRDFAEQIGELSVRRKVAEALREGLDSLGTTDEDSGVEDIEEMVARIQDTASIAMQRSAPARPHSSAGMIQRVKERAKALNESGEEAGAKCSTIPDMDKVMGLLQPGFHIIGGRPGMCKTTLACSAAWGYAANGSPQEYVHGEMTPDQMAMRHLSDLSHAMKMEIRHDRIRDNALEAEDLRKMQAISDMATTLPMTFTAARQWDIRRVEALAERRARYWKSQGRKLGGLWIDYLQKFLASDEKGRPITDDTARINAISSACVRIAERLEIPVVGLSQLGRQVEDRKDKRPQLNDLKGSGNLEQDADSVIFVFREEEYWIKEKPKNKDEMSREMQDWQTHYDCIRGKIELIGEKNRHGSKRTRTVKFFGPYYAVRGGTHNSFDDPLLGAAGLFEEQEEGAWA